MTACPSRYAHDRKHMLPVDRRAREITLEYSRKFKWPNREYVAEKMGQGGDMVGPF